jgi:hypothetical protein
VESRWKVTRIRNVLAPGMATRPTALMHSCKVDVSYTPLIRQCASGHVYGAPESDCSRSNPVVAKDDLLKSIEGQLEALKMLQSSEDLQETPSAGAQGSSTEPAYGHPEHSNDGGDANHASSE